MNAVTKRKLPKWKPLKRKTKQRLRILFYIASLGLAFLIQTSVFPLIPFLAASPNLLLILTFSFGFLHGSLPGMIYGLGAGLLMDLFYSGPFGFFSRFYYEEYITLPMFMCVFNLMIYHIYIYVFRFLIRLKLNLLYYGLHVVLPSIVFSLLVTLVLYRFFFSAHERIER